MSVLGAGEVKHCDMPVLLILRHHGLGDLITAQPSLIALKRQFPNHNIITTCPTWLADLSFYFGTTHHIVTDKASHLPNNGLELSATNHRSADEAILTNVISQLDRADIIISLRTPGLELLNIIEELRPSTFISYHHPALPSDSRFPELDFFRSYFNTLGKIIKTYRMHTKYTRPLF